MDIRCDTYQVLNESIWMALQSPLKRMTLWPKLLWFQVQSIPSIVYSKLRTDPPQKYAAKYYGFREREKLKICLETFLRFSTSLLTLSMDVFRLNNSGVDQYCCEMSQKTFLRWNKISKCELVVFLIFQHAEVKK